MDFLGLLCSVINQLQEHPKEKRVCLVYLMSEFPLAFKTYIPALLLFYLPETSFKGNHKHKKEVSE